MKTFFVGVNYHWQGFQKLTSPGIKRYVIIPLILNILFFIAFLYGFSHYYSVVNAWFAEHFPSWAYWLGTLLWLGMMLGFMVIFVFAFVTIANIFAAPFNGMLAAKVAEQLGKTLPEVSYWQTLYDIPRTVYRQLLVLKYYLPRFCLLLFLFFIPLVHLIITPLWFLFNAWMFSLTYLDYPADNDRVSFPKVLQFVYDQPFLAIGFGSSVLFCSMIPFINFFTMPAAVIGATLLWADNKSR